MILKIGVGLILVGIIISGYYQILSLHEQNSELTAKLDSAIQTLNVVQEHSKIVADATVRLERADADRQEQLRGFEKNLGKIAAASAEHRALLRTVVPDDFLRGLRSFQATPRSNSSATGSGKSTNAP